MKLRRNQQVLIELSEVESVPPIVLCPVIMAGGPAAEQNRLAMIENMVRIYGGKWSARVVYRFRGRQHLRRWLDRGGAWRKSLQA